MNNEFLKQIKKMQTELEKKQQELNETIFTVEKQGVTVAMKGNYKLESIKIDEFLVDPEDKDILEDLLVLTLNEAIEKVEAASEEIAPKMPGGMPF